MSRRSGKRPTGTVLRAREVAKSFRSGSRTIEVLQDASLDLIPGETLSIRGESGSGKSTLLNLLAGIEHPDSGEIAWKERSIRGQVGRHLARQRARFLGFVFQAFYLIPELTVLENVVLAGRIAERPLREVMDRAGHLLGDLGLGGREQSEVSELSGGERQRVAIARALVNQPAVVLADEPTGNLDERTAGRVMDQLMGICGERGAALLLVTHNPEFAGRTQRQLVLENGRLQDMSG